MPCSACNSEKVFARGLCGGCYHRLRRSGSVERKNAQNAGKKCSASGCTGDAHAKGLCLVHYDRQRHPLINTWKLIKSRYPGLTPARWDRLDGFVADVGERPSPKHQLRRIDEEKPYGRSNVRWVEPITRGDYYAKEDRQRYARDWQLQAKYGLSRQQYDGLLKSQGGVCAICQSKAVMHVDHCHKTSLVRGLLCISCNRGIGYFKDDPERLQRAIAYLERSK